MSYPRIVDAIFNSPWAIHRPFFGTMFPLMQSRIFSDSAQLESFTANGAGPMFRAEQSAASGKGKGGNFSASRITKRTDGRLIDQSARIHSEALQRCGGDAGTYHTIVREEEAALPPGQILHVFGSGVLGKHLSSMDEMCAGGLSVDRIQSAITAAEEDDKVSGVMLHLDTPGGICYGMPETFAMVKKLRETKTVAAFCDSLTASAGQWCIAASDVVYVTPSADLGSIGVYSAFTDYTEWCKKNGITVEVIADGVHKGAGYPGTALTEEQRTKIKADVLECSRQFKDDIRSAREGITDETMQGQCFTGKSAVEAKLADAVVINLNEALADLAKAI